MRMAGNGDRVKRYPRLAKGAQDAASILVGEYPRDDMKPRATAQQGLELIGDNRRRSRIMTAVDPERYAGSKPGQMREDFRRYER